jgi:hypothetical protein
MTGVMCGARIDLLFTMSDNTSAARRCRRRPNTILTNEPVAFSDRLVEPDGIEPTTSCLQSRRSPN